MVGSILVLHVTLSATVRYVSPTLQAKHRETEQLVQGHTASATP
jgi:hypothetical protein